jgi:N-acetylneuraminate synthase
MTFSREIKLQNKTISYKHPTLFIAEIASNFNGSLSKAKDLIYGAKEAGADIAKFQHYTADTLVSDIGFKKLKKNSSHQKKWKKSVFETYKQASLNNEWTQALKKTCDDAKIIFMTSAYSFDLINSVNKFVPAFKIGSGEITWLDQLKYVAKKKKPIFLATGASDIEEVIEAVDIIKKYNNRIVLMQCNTNYTNTIKNLDFLNLSVIKTYQSIFPNILTGLSDHTQNDEAVFAAVSMGARLIERHFTKSTKLNGPDHSFSTDIKSFKKLVTKTRQLENMLGDGIKKIEENEQETVIVQRRGLYANKKIKKAEIISKKHIVLLRPCLKDGISANSINKLIGKKALQDIEEGEILKKKFFSS